MQYPAYSMRQSTSEPYGKFYVANLVLQTVDSFPTLPYQSFGKVTMPSEGTISPSDRLDRHPRLGMQPDQLICKCGEQAPYLFLVQLDTNTGEPLPYDGKLRFSVVSHYSLVKVSLGIKRAICPSYKCGFQMDWIARESTREYSRSRSHHGVNPTQQGEFDNVSINGNRNHIGSKIPRHFSLYKLPSQVAKAERYLPHRYVEIQL
ncbi:hypothetical protein F4810DRAFT_130209 [Camillea tinctor]|nr:hypothetical protein F4810DRAFT_130209 [Camillea tinctor]